KRMLVSILFAFEYSRLMQKVSL
ncbi:hypothetical protein HMPREF1018_01246, partial [Bacteroides fragilis]